MQIDTAVRHPADRLVGSQCGNLESIKKAQRGVAQQQGLARWLQLEVGVKRPLCVGAVQVGREDQEMRVRLDKDGREAPLGGDGFVIREGKSVHVHRHVVWIVDLDPVPDAPVNIGEGADVVAHHLVDQKRRAGFARVECADPAKQTLGLHRQRDAKESFRDCDDHGPRRLIPGTIRGEARCCLDCERIDGLTSGLELKRERRS